MPVLGGYPPMPPVRLLPRRRGLRPWVAALLVTVGVLAWPVNGFVRSVGPVPVVRVPFSAEYARDIFADATSCAGPDETVTHGTSGDWPPFGSEVRWYRAVAWNGRTDSGAEQIANACLGLQPSLTVEAWFVRSSRVAPNGLGESWDPDFPGMVADNAFGASPTRYLQHTDIHEPHGLARIVYVHRSSDATRYDVHLYMFNWD